MRRPARLPVARLTAEPDAEALTYAEMESERDRLALQLYEAQREKAEWLEYRGLPPGTSLKVLIETERDTARLAAGFDFIRDHGLPTATPSPSSAGHRESGQDAESPVGFLAAFGPDGVLEMLPPVPDADEHGGGE
jgi:hypothetical protein